MIGKPKKLTLLFGLFVLISLQATAQLPVKNVLTLGGFKCLDLRPFANDHYFEMYEMGEWIHSSFRQDIWKRLGVPYWYSENQGNIRVGAHYKTFPKEVVIPINGINAKDLWFLGHVGGGFDTSFDKTTSLGEYEIIYENGKKEIIQLIGNVNIADTGYGHFVDGAQFAYGQIDTNSVKNDSRPLSYHLGESLPVDPKKQLMVFRHKLKFPKIPLRAIHFRSVKENSFLILQAITLHCSGPVMSPLVYNGKKLNPTPPSAPPGGISWLERHRPAERMIRLDGIWEYRTDPGNKGIRKEWFKNSKELVWKSMKVPSQWFVEGLDYHGVVWYKRKINIPEKFPGEMIDLFFERVDYDARVWINGSYVGRHYGAYQSFILDVTRFAKKGNENEIVVRVESPIDPGVQFYKTIAKGNAMDDIAQPFGEEGSMGGIYRSAFIVGRGNARIEDLWVQSKIAPDLSHAKSTLAFSLTTAIPVTVTCTLAEHGGINPRHFVKHINTGVSDSSLQQVVFDIPQPKLWYPWEQGEPYLYELTVEVKSGTHVLDRHRSRVGIKEVAFNRAEHCVYVNHHRTFIKGMLFDDPHWQSQMDRRAYRYRLQMMKDANLNEVRLTTHQSSPEFYELADEMGMMVWQETPLQWWYSHRPVIHHQILNIVSETIRQTRGRACVIGYSAWNEGGQPKFSDEVVQLMQRLDSTKVISRSSGRGDFDVHVYPTQNRNPTRNTPFWSGFKFAFISETGAYGMPSIKSLHGMFGNDLFKYGGAEYFWDPFTRWGFDDGPAFADIPFPAIWPVDQLEKFILSKAEESSRFYWQVMKSMYETTRSQMFHPGTSCVYCRFDDAFPTAWLGLVNFIGQPTTAYYGVRQACQTVLPVLDFDALGASAVSVINEYWKRSWKDAVLTFQLFDRQHKLIKKVTRKFNLPNDSVVQVVRRDEIGDLWDNRNGFFADLIIKNAQGDTISTNNYDLTGKEIQDFTRSVYPAPPLRPYDAVMATDSIIETSPDQNKIPVSGAYSKQLTEIKGKDAWIKLTVEIPESNNYNIRPAADTLLIRNCGLRIDGRPAELETYRWKLDDPIGREPWSDRHIEWYAGWKAWLSKGKHTLELRLSPNSSDVILLDAIAIQPR